MELASALSMHTFDAINGFFTRASQSGLKEPNKTPDLLDLSQTKLKKKKTSNTKCTRSDLRASKHEGADLLQDLLLPGEFISWRALAH